MSRRSKVLTFNIAVLGKSAKQFNRAKHYKSAKQFNVAFLGIQTEETLKNSAAYIQSWKRFIQDDPKAVVFAASRAEKAANFILGNFKPTEEE